MHVTQGYVSCQGHNAHVPKIVSSRSRSQYPFCQKMYPGYNFTDGMDWDMTQQNLSMTKGHAMTLTKL